MQEHRTGINLLEELGLRNLGNIYWNLSTPALYEEIIRRREGWISHLGPLVVHTGHHTGRSPHHEPPVARRSLREHRSCGRSADPFPLRGLCTSSAFSRHQPLLWNARSGVSPSASAPSAPRDNLFGKRAWWPEICVDLGSQVGPHTEQRKHD